MNVVPEGYHTVTPWLITAGRTAELIDFITEVFDATELGRVGEAPRIGHAEVRIGDSVVMLFDVPDWPSTPAFLRLYIADDATGLKRAVALGSRIVTEPTELFWGDRVSRFADPRWSSVMAGTLCSIAPIMCLFLLLQKEFISGLTSGAVKG